MRRHRWASALVVLAVTLAAPAAHAQAPSEFADWTAVDANVATGTLLGRTVSLSGSRIDPSSTLDGTSTAFASPLFSPPLPTSDAIAFYGDQGYSYTLTFGAPTRDPVLHVLSLASTLQFTAGTPITKVSGEDTFTVSGSSVAGVLAGSSDASGTIRLSGTFSAISFTATPVYTAGTADGIYLQVGGSAVSQPPVPEPPRPPNPPPTPPPPPPPPAPAPTVDPPTIDFAARAASGTTYRCVPGRAEGIGANASFTFAWYRLGSVTGTFGGGFREKPTVRVATTQNYTVPPADFGQKYYCEVTVRTASLASLTRYSATVLLTGRDESIGQLAPRFYGDVRIRGIDVFQVVQPESGALMYGYPAGFFPSLCGGGTPTIYSLCGPAPANPQRVNYVGVPLDQRKRAVAFVHLDMDGTEESDPTQVLNVTLSGRVGATALGGALTQRFNNPAVSTTPWVTAAERTNANFHARFALPAAWLAAAATGREPLGLEATVGLPLGAGAGALRECPLLVVTGNEPGCAQNNRFRLDGVPVHDDFADITVRSVPLVCTRAVPECLSVRTAATCTGRSAPGCSALASPEKVLEVTRTLFPGTSRLSILPYDGSVDITDDVDLVRDHPFCAGYRSKPPVTPPGGTPETAAQKDEREADDTRECRQAHVEASLESWLANDPKKGSYNVVMGVHRYQAWPTIGTAGAQGEPGWKYGASLAVGKVPRVMVNDGSFSRPITAAAHEFGHALGFPHADNPATFVDADGDGNDDSDCGGGGEQWSDDGADDGRGRMQGVGVEFRPRLFGFTTTWRPDTDPSPVYDLMSYCHGGDDRIAWLSARNWNRAVRVLRDLAAATRRGATARAALAGGAQAGGALAIGVVGPEGARIVRVVRAEAGVPAPAPDPDSPLRVRALDASGATVSDVGAAVSRTEESDAATFIARVPAAANAVEVTAGGTVLDRRQRSRPPTVRLTAPGRGARVTASGRLAVRWTASDPDGDPLRVTIDYAADRSGWRTVFQGPSTGGASVPGRFLAGSSRARVRVSVDDGFNQARAGSVPFQVSGTPPTARIVLPAEGDAPQAGRTLLIGSARDDQGRRLRGRALTWFVGSRRLGTGERLQAALPAGRIRLRLVARDARGRVGAATRRLTVAPVLLALRGLRVPDRVAAGASRLAVTLSTTVPARVRAGGRTFRVGPRARRVFIPLPRRSRTGVVKVRLTITAAGPRQPPLQPTVVVLRG